MSAHQPTSRKNRIRILTSLGDLTGTGVLVVKSGDESDRVTSDIDLVMDRTLGENSSLTCTQGIDDKASPVLLDEPSFHVTIGEVKDLGRSGVGMGCVHSARSKQWVNNGIGEKIGIARLTPSDR